MLLNFIKLFFITLFTLKFNDKLLDIKNENKIKNICFRLIILIVINTDVLFIKKYADTTISIIFLIMSLALLFSYKIKKNIGYSIMITIISFCISNIIYIISVVLSYIIFRFLYVNDYATMIGILLIYILLYELVYNMKKLKYGISFLKKNEQNEYLGLLILNIATGLVLAVTVFSNIKTNIEVMKSVFIYIIFLLLGI